MVQKAKHTKAAIVCYVPVLHEGYHQLFKKYPNAKNLYIFGDEIIANYEHLIKDIRRLPVTLIQKSILSWKIFDSVKILNKKTIKELQQSNTKLITSDDDITNELVSKYFLNNPIKKDTIFLRWDKKTSIAQEQISPDVKISGKKFDEKMMDLAKTEGKKSKDWWRRIGALVVKDGKILFKIHNTYVPSDQIAHAEGDPRSNFKSGVHLESSLALHAEASIVAWAAKEGISLKGTDVYTETFPCPPCAKQLAYSGIKRLFYRTGYKVLDGERILRSQGVEIIFVN